MAAVLSMQRKSQAASGYLNIIHCILIAPLFILGWADDSYELHEFFVPSVVHAAFGKTYN
jgi:hypothetical protein